MRKILSSLIALGISVSAWSQFSAGVGGTYTQFKGHFRKTTPGFQTRVLYELGSYGVGVSYTYHAPFHIQSSVYSRTDLSDPTTPVIEQTKISFLFQTADILVRRTILGGEDAKAKLYGGLGASLVLLVYKEKPKAPLTFTPIFPLDNGQYRGLSLNGLLGSEYKLGRVSLYGEASYSVPTKARQMRYLESFRITAPRLSFLLGIKLPVEQ
ncbi:MAG TPA: hypothetical protein VEZ55_04770 [Chitinophagaceae bacterium]|jgi:hypothetical protein|nr:hypothetical protein [Chitinophagaceae bacterium]